MSALLTRRLSCLGPGIAWWRLLPPPLLASAFLAAAPATAQSQVAGADVAPELPVEIGDKLRLKVWRQDDYSGEFLVDTRGRATLPLVGEWEVAGADPAALEARLTEAFRRTLRDPVVDLEVLHRVRVLGEVLEPGVFYLDGTMAVADALAMAGGRTLLAHDGAVTLRRTGGVIEADVRTDVRLSELPIRSGDELMVPRRSWLDRNVAAAVSGGVAFFGLLVAIALR